MNAIEKVMVVRLENAKQVKIISSDGTITELHKRQYAICQCAGDDDAIECSCYNGSNIIYADCWRPVDRVKMEGSNSFQFQYNHPSVDPSYDDICSYCLVKEILSTQGRILIIN